MTDQRLIGLFGGSFDPPHAGHLHVAARAREAFGLDRVIFVPAARPPHKPDRVLASDADRLAMLGLMVSGRGCYSVSDVELGREGPSYTYDTVQALPAEVGEAEDVGIAMLIGSDNLVGLERWHRVSDLLARVQPIVVRRGAGEVELPEALLRVIGPAEWQRLRAGVLQDEPFPCSSSALRRDLARGASVAGRLPFAVADYVYHHGLYRTPEASSARSPRPQSGA